jgi:hypothetical protein
MSHRHVTSLVPVRLCVIDIGGRSSWGGIEEIARRPCLAPAS